MNGVVTPEALLERLGLFAYATAAKAGTGGAKKKPKAKEEGEEEEEEEDDDNGGEEGDDEEDDDGDDDDKASAKERKLLKEVKSLRKRERERTKKDREREEEEEEARAESEAKAGEHQKTIDRQKKTIDEITAERDGWKQKYEGKVVDDGISAALDAVNINPKLKKGAVKVIRDDHEVEMDDDGDATIDGDPIDKFIKRWAKSDVGKAYVRNRSSGGGADNEGDEGGEEGSKTNPWKKGAEFNLTQQGKIIRENPKLAERLKREAGAA